MDNVAQVVIVGLAGWRLASMLVMEEGPADIFARVRKRLGAGPGEIHGFLPGVLSCVWCCSVWTTAAMLGLWYVTWLIPGAFAGMAIAIGAGRFFDER